MKTKLIISGIVFCIGLLSSCKKEDPKPQDETTLPQPVFSFSGEINGVPVSINAGTQGYLLTTDDIIDANGVHEFVSILKNQNSVSEGPNSLKISLKDYQINTGSISNVNNSIHTGYFSFATPSGGQEKFKQSFVALMFNGNGKSYVWNFGDETSEFVSSSDSAVHIYSQPGIYTVALNVKDSLGNNISSITNNVKIGQIGNWPTAQFYPTSLTPDNTVSFISIPIGGTAPYTYSWNFGDGAASTLPTPTYHYNNPGVYTVSLNITDAAGVSDTKTYNVPVNTNDICVSTFYCQTEPILSPINLSSVIIEWRDANGTLWTSKDDNQHTEKSYFKIVSIEDYAKNDKGESTKKVKVESTCKLYNGASSIYLRNAKATIALAYR